MTPVLWIPAGLLLIALLALYIHDRWFSSDNIVRNYPVSGHLRYLLIELGPKLRQYIVADNREELPFNRDEREWIERSAAGQNNYFGFGTDDQIYDSPAAIARYRQNVPGAQTHLLPGTGHSPNVERPRLVAPLVLAFASPPPAKAAVRRKKPPG